MISFTTNNIDYTVAFPLYPVSLFVDHFVIMKGEGLLREEKIFPNNKSELFINLGGGLQGKMNESTSPFYLNESVISGVRDTFFSFIPGQNFFMAGLRFTLFGFYHLFGIPSNHFMNQNFDTKDVWGNEMEWLREQLLESSNQEGLFDTLNNWVLRRMTRTDLSEILKWRKVEHEIKQPGVPVHTLLQKVMGYSHKHSIQLIREKSGLKPKMIQKVNRFDVVLRMLAKTKLPDLTPLAYADQSHFIREFKQFTGLTPGDYLHDKPRVYLLYQQLEEFDKNRRTG